MFFKETPFKDNCIRIRNHLWLWICIEIAIVYSELSFVVLWRFSGTKWFRKLCDTRNRWLVRAIKMEECLYPELYEDEEEERA